MIQVLGSFIAFSCIIFICQIISLPLVVQSSRVCSSENPETKIRVINLLDRFNNEYIIIFSPNIEYNLITQSYVNVESIFTGVAAKTLTLNCVSYLNNRPTITVKTKYPIFAHLYQVFIL